MRHTYHLLLEDNSANEMIIQGGTEQLVIGFRLFRCQECNKMHMDRLEVAQVIQMPVGNDLKIHHDQKPLDTDSQV